MSSANYSKYGNNTKCNVTLYFEQTANGASFYFSYSGFCNAYYHKGSGDKDPSRYMFYGNSAGYIRMDVDGTYTGGPYKYAGAKTSGKTASGSGWIGDLSGTSNTINLPAKNTPYIITIRWTGNFSATETRSVTYSFNLPIYINDDGTVRAVTKAYANVDGVIKECAVYVNVDGVIKQLQ